MNAILNRLKVVAMLVLVLFAISTVGRVTKAATTVDPGASDPTAQTTAGDKVKKEDPIYIKVLGMSIAVVAVVMGCSIPLMAIWIDYARQRDAMANFHKERMAALEKGLEPPEFPKEFLSDEARGAEIAMMQLKAAGATGQGAIPHAGCQGSGLKAGIVWLGIGFGTLILLHFQQVKFMHTVWSGVPIAIGVACIVGYLIERRRRAAIEKINKANAAE